MRCIFPAVGPETWATLSGMASLRHRCQTMGALVCWAEAATRAPGLPVMVLSTREQARDKERDDGPVHGTA
jgi:hypothetical protein